MSTWICPTCRQVRNPWDRSVSGLCWTCHYKEPRQKQRIALQLRPPKWPRMDDGEIVDIHPPRQDQAVRLLKRF